MDFIAEMTLAGFELASTWVMFSNISSSNRRSDDDIILENKVRLVIEVYSRFKFPITNNQPEYEAFIIDLTLAIKIGTESFKLHTNPYSMVS